MDAAIDEHYQMVPPDLLKFSIKCAPLGIATIAGVIGGRLSSLGIVSSIWFYVATAGLFFALFQSIGFAFTFLKIVKKSPAKNTSHSSMEIIKSMMSDSERWLGMRGRLAVVLALVAILQTLYASILSWHHVFNQSEISIDIASVVTHGGVAVAAWVLAAVLVTNRPRF